MTTTDIGTATPSPRDAAIAVALAIGAAASRLPFRSSTLYHWDSVNFARALDHFDIEAAQPHHPGYLLYVLLGRAARLMTGDAQAALVAISVMGSGLAVAMLYVLGTAMFTRRVALIAALGLASSPLFWFYGEVALPHALDAFLVITAVWLAWRVIAGERHVIVALALWLALTGAIRPQSETFLLPLTLYAAVRSGWHRGLVTAALVLVVANLAWLVPLLWLSGGAAAYTESSRVFYARFSDTTTIWAGGLRGLTRNGLKLGMYTAYGWSLGALALLLVPSRLGHAPAIVRDSRTHVLLLWVLPALGVYLFIHMGQQGLVFVFLPALWLLSAVLLSSLPTNFGTVSAAVIIAINAAVFLFAPTFPFGGDRPKLLTTDTLQRHDDELLTRVAAVRDRLPKERTIIVSSSWRFPQFYLSEYPLVPYTLGSRWEADEGRPISGDERWVDPARYGISADQDTPVVAVLFDDDLLPFNRSPERLEWISLSDGKRLPVLSIRAGEGMMLNGSSLRVAPLDRHRAEAEE